METIIPYIVDYKLQANLFPILPE